MADILETLQNAKINLIENKNTPFGFFLGKLQLENAVELLEKGYSLNDDVDNLLEKFGSVSEVPSKEK